mgnify:CR=1 FL=1
MADESSPAAHDKELELYPPCRVACPVHTNTRAYVDLIRTGRYEEAFEEIRRTNPFPSVCSLICHHPCEAECRRNDVDEGLALRHLKRFVTEKVQDYREKTRKPAKITESQSVGVIGSGPAGLTVAYDCVRAGYPVTVYEALPAAGGLLACAIPRYRLPWDALEEDLEDIRALGVDIKTDTKAGEDVSWDELHEKHDSLVLAAGLSKSRSIPLENGDHPDVKLALPFLRASALDEPQEVKDHVIVIGGGNVAVDVARTAIRLGAETVKMICLENEEELPAWDWESEEALEEGIEIIHREGPTEVIVDDGEITGLVTRAVERVFDEDGNFSPTYFDDQISRFPGQMIVLAIGQQADLDFLEGSGLECSRPGRLEFHPETMSTSEKGIFSCGEVIAGPGSAIEAVASGHRAAQAVLNYLETGELKPVEEEEFEEVQDFPEHVPSIMPELDRQPMAMMSPEERKKSFTQFELGYDEAQALSEAWRCVSCAAGARVDEDRCAACLTCVRICPFDAPTIEDIANMPAEICQACGLCAAECPADCIMIQRIEDAPTVPERVQELIDGTEQTVTTVEIVCAHDAKTREELVDRLEKRNGTSAAILPVGCAGATREVDMLKPFELGVKDVKVRLCSDCIFEGADDRIRKRVARTKELLEEVGLSGDQLVLESEASREATK